MKVFLDVNIVMYAAGAPHPHKEPSARLLQRVAENDVDVLTDTEILQELLYRYWHLKRVPQGVALVEQVVRLVPVILPVTTGDAVLAASLLGEHPQIEPRDAIHAAVMLNAGITHLYSYDEHFDRVAGLKRLLP